MTQEATRAELALDNLAWKHGITPIITCESQTGLAGEIAAYSAAPAFIERIIAQAEPLAAAGNQTALRAAMIEAFCWMMHLNDLSEEGLEFEPLDDEDEDEPEYLEPLRRAEERMKAATQRYEEMLTAPERPGADELMKLWRAYLAIPAHAAMLDHHLEALAHADSMTDTEGHNLAALDADATMGFLIQELKDKRKTTQSRVKTTGPRPSIQQVNQHIQAAREARKRCSQAGDLLRKTMPIRISDSIPGHQQDEAVLLAQNTIKSSHEYGIQTSNNNPGESLIAYRHNVSMHVKGITDAYDEDFPRDEAQQQAEEFQEAAQHMEEAHGQPEYHRIADLIHLNAEAGLHTVDRQEFASFLETARKISHNPLEVQEAVLDALCPAHRGTKLLFELAGTDETKPTDEQSGAVMKAAREAGLEPGRLRALCAVLGLEPSREGIEPAQAQTSLIIEFLEASPVMLDHCQAISILTGLGGNREDPAAIEWIEENCDQHDQYDDDDDDDDDE